MPLQLTEAQSTSGLTSRWVVLGTQDSGTCQVPRLCGRHRYSDLGPWAEPERRRITWSRLNSTRQNYLTN